MKFLIVALTLIASAVASAQNLSCGAVLKGTSQREKIVGKSKITITTFTVEVSTCGKVESDDFEMIINGMDQSGFAYSFIVLRNPEQEKGCKRPTRKTVVQAETTDIPTGFPIIWGHSIQLRNDH